MRGMVQEVCLICGQSLVAVILHLTSYRKLRCPLPRLFVPINKQPPHQLRLAYDGLIPQAASVLPLGGGKKAAEFARTNKQHPRQQRHLVKGSGGLAADTRPASPGAVVVATCRLTPVLPGDKSFLLVWSA